MAQKFILLSSSLAAQWLLGFQPLYAQDQSTEANPGTENSGEDRDDIETLVSSGPKHAAQAQGPGLGVTLKRKIACGRDPIMPTTAADAFGCSFTNTTAGFSYADGWTGDTASFGAKIEVTRATSGAFALDHQMRGYGKGLNAEAIVTNISIDGSLFDGRVEVEAKTSSSRSWDVPVASAPLNPHRLNERSGSARQLRVKTRLVDTSDVKWSLEGRFSNIDEGYQAYRAPIHNRLFAAQGSSRSLTSLLDVGGWRLKASSSASDTAYLKSDTTGFSARHSGITVRGSRRISETQPRGLLASAAMSRSTKSRLAVDFEMFSLMPLVAIEDTGVKSLVPKMLTIEAARTEIERFHATGTETITRSSVGGQGYWTTPLGDTLVNLRLENQVRDRPGASVRSGTDLFVFVNHSFSIGDWSLDFDYFTSRNAISRQFGGSDDTILDSYGIAARYQRKDMPTAKIRLGRDNLGFDTNGGDLRLRDQSLRAKAELDFSPLLQKRFKRDDISLTLEFQYDLEESSYEFSLLDAVVDSDFNRARARGLLMNLSMRFP